MPYVITQACCNDASCVSVCPANCIHPTPEEPEFLTAEMLYIDPDSCIDCGACADECPVGAAVDIDELEARHHQYPQINADYYRDHDVLGGLLAANKRPTVPEGRELSVAIVGAGPSGFYAAAELLRGKRVTVDMYDRLPTPYGLVRAGVAPDHPETKGVEAGFAATAAKSAFTYHLGIEVGTEITHRELMERYSAVLYTSGAHRHRRLGIPGEDLDGCVPAADVVAWYNGHPDHAATMLDLSAERVVIVGNGNVALDVARVLLTDPETLAQTDIADHAIAALRQSKVREVVLLGRRSVADAAYTNAEFMALGDLEDVDVVVDPADLVLDPETERKLSDRTLDVVRAHKIELAREYAARPPTGATRRMVFRYLAGPLKLTGDERVESITCARNECLENGEVADSEDRFQIDTGLVVPAIGYRGSPIAGLPFDDDRGIVPNLDGRVQELDGEVVAGTYVAGWIRRGATGGIGRNRLCGETTALAILSDYAAGHLADPILSRSDIPDLLAARGVDRVDGGGWVRIDDQEKNSGRQQKRPRVKLVHRADLHSVAGSR